MVSKYGEAYAMADSIPFVDGGCVKRLSNLRRFLFRAKTENEPFSKPMTMRSVTPSPSDASMAMDMGSRGVSSSLKSSVDANSSRSFLELHARSPEIESAA
jgi:hypothetical protein